MERLKGKHKSKLRGEQAFLQEPVDQIANALRELRSAQSALLSFKDGVFSEPLSLIVGRLEAAQLSAMHATHPLRELVIKQMVMEMEALEPE